uniref:PAS domain S-box protein n=1 Tax=Aetokthonos hydrillicola TaxID=1550245 RepID=UPI001ABBC4BF
KMNAPLPDNEAARLVALSKYEKSLNARVNQQAAVAKLGQLALEGCDLYTLMDEAVALVIQSLEVEYCEVLELIEDGKAALLRAGGGWQEGLVGSAKVSTDMNSQAGYILLAKEPLIVENQHNETRFSNSPLLEQHQVISSLSVIILGQNMPYGILAAHTTEQRTFVQDDINFLQAIANVLAQVISRKCSEQTLQASLKNLADLKFALDQSSIVAITDPNGTITYVNDKFCEISKYSRVELLGQNYRIINSGYHSKEFFRLMWQTITSGEVWKGQIKNRSKDGTFYWIETTIVPLLNSHCQPEQYVAIHNDITERKRAEQALQQSEERFRALVDGVKDYAIFMLDPNGFIISWNHGAERINGYLMEEILGHHFSCFFPVEEIENNKPQQELNTASLQGRFEGEGWRLRKDGSLFWANEIITALRNESGQLQGFSTVIRDVTERQQIEQALRKAKDELEMRVAERTAELISVNEQLQAELDERKRTQEALRVSQARFAGILDIADDAIISVDINQHINLFNQGAEKIFGYTAKEVLGQPLDLLLPLQYSQVHRQHVVEFASSSGKARRMGERRKILARRKDGTQFPAEASISKLEIGEETVFTVILRDITANLQSQEALERLSRQNVLILNSMGEGLCGLDKSGRITFVNSAAAKLLGYNDIELIGQSIEIILPHSNSDGRPYSLTNSPIYASLSDASVHQVTNEVFRRKNNSSFSVEYVSTPIKEQGEVKGAVITFKDITDRQMVERMKDEFISVVSHELRTPLTSIHGSLGMLASGLVDPSSQRGKRLLAIAVDSTERLVRLVNDILDIERIKSGKETMMKHASDAADLMTEAIDVMQPMAQQYEVNLSVLPVSVQLWVDGDRIIQTLTNLLSNAIKFSRPGGTVWLSANCHENYIIFQVKDQGRGIPSDKLEAIFERFQQVDASDSRLHEGTGLGL